jgi:hypothetical protein
VTLFTVGVTQMYTNYQVVEANASRNLSNKVNELMGEGWQPYGHMLITPEGKFVQPMTEGSAKGTPSDMDAVNNFVQALTEFEDWSAAFVAKLNADAGITANDFAAHTGPLYFSNWCSDVANKLNADATVAGTTYGADDEYIDLTNVPDDLDQAQQLFRTIALWSEHLVAKLNADAGVTDSNYTAFETSW